MRRQAFINICSIFFLLFSQRTILHAQPYYFKHFTIENGLSSTTTTSVLLDKKGFLWIGTLDGLNRFDGYDFKIYRNILGDSTSLGCNAIWRMFQCNNGTIWLVTDCGIYIFNPLTETFFRPKNFPKGFINGIAEDKNNIMWIAIEGKLYRYNPETYVAKLIEGNSTHYFTACLVSGSNELIVGTRDGKIGLFDSAANRFSFYPVFENTAGTDDRHYIFSLFDNGNASLLIGTMHEGVKLFSLRDHVYKNIFAKDSKGADVSVKDFCRINPNEVWIATENGIFVYNEATGKYTGVQKTDRDPNSLSDNSVLTICKDKEGGIWAATYFGGLNYCSPAGVLFEKFVTNIDSSSLQGTGIGQIATDNNNLWIGTGTAGINKYNTLTKRFTHFTATGKKGALAYNNIQSLLCDSNELYIGTYVNGMDIMDLRTEKVVHHYAPGNLNGLKNNEVSYIYKATDNNLWICNRTTIYTYNKKQKTFRTVSAFPENVIYNSILETKDGTMWAVSYLSGVFYYNPQKGIAGKLHFLFKGKDLFENNNTLYLKEAKDGTLWITSTNGLFHINLKNLSAKVYSTKDGLPSNIVCSIIEDSLGRFWIPTSQGLAIMEKDLKTIKVFHKSNGLLDDEFSYGSAYQAKNGQIYLGSLKGMISFDPSAIKFDNYKPGINFTNFSVYNTPLKVDRQNGPLYESLAETDHITLKHNQSSFNIEFAALCYTSPDNVQYAYEMENFDNKWVNIKSNRNVNFTGLPGGEYVFKVRSTNGSGVWQDNTRVLRITILPPIWKTSWAYCIYLIIIILLICFIARAYKRRLIYKQKRQMEMYEIQKEKELHAAKADFMTRITHEIRTPLTLIKVPIEMAIRETKGMADVQEYLEIMDKNAERLKQLTDQLLDLRKIETDHFALNMSEVNLIKLLEEIYANFNLEIKNRGIIFKLKFDDVGNIYADKEALTKIITNLFDNAIKYCEQNVIVEVRLIQHVSDMVEISVSNDGMIIPEKYREMIFAPFFRIKETEKARGTGIGLAISQSLAELHKGSLTFRVNKSFNSFILLLPQNRH